MISPRFSVLVKRTSGRPGPLGAYGPGKNAGAFVCVPCHRKLGEGATAVVALVHSRSPVLALGPLLSWLSPGTGACSYGHPRACVNSGRRVMAPRRKRGCGPGAAHAPGGRTPCHMRGTIHRDEQMVCFGSMHIV